MNWWRFKKRVWFLEIEGERVGPFTLEELRAHKDLTPFTKVWKRGFTRWYLAGQVAELSSIFEERGRKYPYSKMDTAKGVSDLMVAVSEERFFSSLWWMLLALSVFFYALIRLWLFTKKH